MNKRILILALSLVLVATAVVSGTLAWLTDSTGPVTNTFSPANIDIDLTETFNAKSSASATANDCWKADMIPGYTYTKDPVVTVKANSVDCYLFVEFKELNNAANYLTYDSTLDDTDSGWTQGTGTGEGKNGVPTNVWFREVTESANDQSWHLLKDDKVTINGTAVTKTYMDTLYGTNPTAQAPELVYTAYATQLYKDNTNKFTPAEAWTNAPKS